MDITPTNPSLADQLAAAQEWWANAGVDCVFEDEPQGWLSDPETPGEKPAAPAPRAEEPPPPPAPKIGGDPAGWPRTLEEFGDWWVSHACIEGAGSRPCVKPRGPKGASLFVMVPMPEEADTDTLLSGPQGRLLEGFLKAAGIPEEKTYIASMMPQHMAMPDWQVLAGQGLGELVRHHVSLASPERVLVLGSRITSLLGHDPASGHSPFLVRTAKDERFAALPHYGLEQMLQNARLKARLWRKWLDWTA